MECVVRRLLNTGMTAEQIADKTQLPLVQIEQIVISLQKK